MRVKRFESFSDCPKSLFTNIQVCITRKISIFFVLMLQIYILSSETRRSCSFVCVCALRVTSFSRADPLLAGKLIRALQNVLARWLTYIATWNYFKISGSLKQLPWKKWKNSTSRVDSIRLEHCIWRCSVETFILWCFDVNDVFYMFIFLYQYVQDPQVCWEWGHHYTESGGQCRLSGSGFRDSQWVHVCLIYQYRFDLLMQICILKRVDFGIYS